MSRRAKAFVAGIDALIMGAFAFSESGGTFGISIPDLVLWGSVVAAAICALIVYLEGRAVVAWAAIGYVLFGALLTGVPEGPLVALCAALMPLVPRPRGSFVYGLGVAIAVAFVTRFAVGTLL